MRKAPSAVRGIVAILLAVVVVAVAFAVIGAFEVDETVKTPDGESSSSPFDSHPFPDPPRPPDVYQPPPNYHGGTVR